MSPWRVFVFYSLQLLKLVAEAEGSWVQDGLQDQMLGIVVAAEEPATEEKRVNLVIESAKAKAQLKDLEDKILQLLSSSTGHEPAIKLFESHRDS